MTGYLDEGARLIVEKNIDAVIQTPKKAEATFRTSLILQGIQPNLETILSMITGFLEGLVNSYYVHRHNRPMTDDEQNDFNTLLSRRAFEMRQAILSTRIEE